MYVPGTLGGFTAGIVAGLITDSTFVYTYISGGISNDTTWAKGLDSDGYFCYTCHRWPVALATPLGRERAATPGGSADATTLPLRGPSVTDAGGPATTVFGTWDGRDNHDAVQGAGDRSFVKKINRPVTYLTPFERGGGVTPHHSKRRQAGTKVPACLFVRGKMPHECRTAAHAIWSKLS